ncbi:MAG: glycosyltransferase family 2 protein [Cytophagales bacterium]|nr:glycosyltransferase family 2 protein [Cytophagales bacterium]
MMNEAPLVSIITINFNNLKVTLELLLSIEECTYQNLQVIVVDNGSERDPTDEIKRKFAEVTVIRSEKNLGFSAGNNLGSKYAKGEFIFFVNNDTLFAENVIERLLDPFREIENLAIVSPKVIYYESPNIIQYAGSTEINALTGRNKVVGQGEVDNDELYKSGETFFAHGAAMIIKKDMLQLIGGFPEIYFLYYEEMDYSYRIRRSGYRIYYYNKAVIYHRVSYSTGEDSPLKTYYMTRNRIMFMQRNFNGFQFTVFILFFVFFTIPKNSLRYLMHMRYDLLKAFFNAIKWNLVTSRKIKLN